MIIQVFQLDIILLVNNTKSINFILRVLLIVCVFIAQIELLPHITWYHNYQVKRKITSEDLALSGIMKIILEVIVPEILTHMISLNLKIDYDDALIILYDSKARLYGEQLDVDEILLLFGKDYNVKVNSTKRQRKRG